MKNRIIKSGIYFCYLFALLIFSNCKKEDETLKELENRDFYIIDVASQTDWNYWVIAKDGSNFAIKTENFVPSVIHYKPSTKEDGYTIFLDKYGVPEKTIINNNIILFGNYTKSTVDVTVVLPDGNIKSFAGISIMYDFTESYNKGVKGQQFDWKNNKDKIIKYGGWAAGGVACVTGVLAALPTGGISLGLSYIGCGSTAVSIASSLLPEDFEVLGMSADVLGIVSTSVGCLTTLNPLDKVACASGILESASSIYFLAKEYVENHQDLEKQASTILETGLTVITNNVTDYTGSTAIVGGGVQVSGNAEVKERGVYWGILPNPNIAGTKLNIGSGSGSYSSTLSLLSPETTYYIVAYASNEKGISIGKQVSFTTTQNYSKPTVSTTSVTMYTSATATVGGNVTADGGSSVTARGIYWGTSQNPETTGTKVQIGSGTGTFSTNLTNLTASTTYYVKAYATNSQGTSYGDQLSFMTSSSSGSNIFFNPSLTYGSVSDIEGNTYKTIQIGSQTWMAENLKTTKYIDGSTIPLVSDNSQWLSMSTPAYSWYNNDITNKSTYGALYNWYTVNTGKICPSGWHVPSDEEWKRAEMFLGMSEATANLLNWRGTNEGGKLKEVGLNHWQSPNSGATNEAGFTGVPGGIRWSVSGTFGGVKANGTCWTSTQYNTSSAYYRGLYWDRGSICRAADPKIYGFSVRCVKDDTQGGSTQELYTNNFSGDLSDWVQNGGTWQIQSGVLYANYGIGCGSVSCSQADLILKDQFQPGGDWSVSVDFTRATDASYPSYSAATAQFSLWVSTSKKVAISVGSGGDNWGTTQLDSISVGYSEWNGTWYKNVFRNIGFKWLPTNWYKMTVEKIGNVYKVYLNDTFLWQYTDTYINGAGKIGLHTYGPKRYDNFVIKKTVK